MAGTTTTYSFDDVECTIIHPLVGQYVINGKGIGSISVTPSTEKTTHDVAADGSVMISKIAGDNAAINIEIQQTSELHKWLTNYYNVILLSPAAAWASASIIIRDPVGGSLISAYDVAPQNKAEKPYQAQGQRITWTMLSGSCYEVSI